MKVNNFKVGSNVETLDDDILGQVIKVENHEIIVLTEDGFEMSFKPNELILVPDQALDFNVDVMPEDIHRKLKPQIKQNINRSKQLKKPELDLHIHELIDDARHLSNFQILNIQLNKAKQKLDEAINNKWPTLIFIHGKGEGVLKAELLELLSKYDKIEFFDADYTTYGTGATEVKIY